MRMQRRSFLGAAAAAASLPAAALSTPALAQGPSKQVLKFVPQANLTSLDPIWTTAAVTAEHAYYVFDTLYGVDGQFRPHPQMAAGHTVSSDGKTYEITLRDGLFFHDGTPVRAADCVASLERWAARDTFGVTVAAAVDAWEAKNDKTIRVRLKHPFPLLIDALAKPASSSPFIMPERLAKTSPSVQITEMVGSGPYMFEAKEYVSGSRVVYRKFDKYAPRQEAPSWYSGGKVAHFERVEWHIIPDPATASAALQSGEIDWWELVLADLIPLLKQQKGVHIGIADPAGYLGVIRFNELWAPFNNPKMREAVMHTVDQQEYMRAVTGNDASAFRVCHSLFPCGTPYGNPLAPDPMAKPNWPLAHKLVKEAGYKGEKVVLINPTDFPTIQPFGEITYANLKKLGLNVDLVETDWGSVVKRREIKAAPDKGGWNIFHTWWTGDGIMNPAINPIIRGQGANGWFGWYKSAKMEALNAAWLTAPTAAKQKAIVTKMQELAFHDVPTVPLGLFYIHTGYRTSLAGHVRAPTAVPWGVHRV
jgi:peptide/nickel transport system substrate-binding protein